MKIILEKDHTVLTEEFHPKPPTKELYAYILTDTAHFPITKDMSSTCIVPMQDRGTT